MDLSFIPQMYMPIVLIACLICGYILKHWIRDMDNKWIPTILTILGGTLACVTKWDIDLTLVVSGALTGLASTGMHQMFKQMIEASKNDDEKK